MTQTNRLEDSKLERYIEIAKVILITICFSAAFYFGAIGFLINREYLYHFLDHILNYLPINYFYLILVILLFFAISTIQYPIRIAKRLREYTREKVIIGVIFSFYLTIIVCITISSNLGLDFGKLNHLTIHDVARKAFIDNILQLSGYVLIGWFISSVIFANNEDFFKLIKVTFPFFNSQNENVKSSETDEAISHYNEDLLGRGIFTISLYNEIVSISKTNKEESYVFGLESEWGDGKTSIVNMLKSAHEENGFKEIIEKNSKFRLKNIEEELEKDKDLVIIDFDPWYFCDQKSGIKAFYEKLESVVKKYCQNPFEDTSIFEKFTKTLFNGVGGKFDFGFMNLDMAWRNDSSQDYELLKDKINILLKKTGKRFLIVLDNIDRMERREILAILKLIKLHGSFEKVTYLLAYDRDKVLTVIDKKDPKYMDKFIQKSWRVPEIGEQKITKVLKGKIIDIIGDDNFDDSKLDYKEFPDSIEEFFSKFQLFKYISKYFRNLRDVFKYTNSLKSTYAGLKGNINSLDIAVLEVFKVFDPETYQHIYKNQSIFVSDPIYEDIDFKHSKRQDKLNQIFTDIQTQIILRYIFPLLTQDYTPQNSRSRKRITHKEYFNLAFEQIPDDETFTDTEIELFIEIINKCDRKTIQDSFNRIEQQKVDYLLFKLNEKSTSINTNTKQLIINKIEKLSLHKDQKAFLFCIAVKDDKLIFSQPEVQGFIYRSPIEFFDKVIWIVLYEERAMWRREITLEFFKHLDKELKKRYLIKSSKKKFFKDIDDLDLKTWPRFINGWITKWNYEKVDLEEKIFNYILTEFKSYPRQFHDFASVYYFNPFGDDKNHEQFRYQDFDKIYSEKHQDFIKLGEGILADPKSGLIEAEKLRIKDFVSKLQES